MNKCVFLDRDGVLNVDNPNYTYRAEDLLIPEEVPEALHLLKEAGFLLIVITNQSGINKGLYTHSEVEEMYRLIQEKSGFKIDAQYYSPYHPNFTNSLGRKPDSLLLEKAIAKYHINTSTSWMVGDHDRDILAARKMQLKTVRVYHPEVTSQHQAEVEADFSASGLLEASRLILQNKHPLNL